MENDQKAVERANEALKLLSELLQDFMEEKKKGNDLLIVWGIPKNVIEEFNKKIIRPKYHRSGMTYRDALSKEITGFMLESIKKHKRKEKKK